MNKLLLLFGLVVLIGSCFGLNCYTCAGQENGQCVDLQNRVMSVQACSSPLENQEFSCVKFKLGNVVSRICGTKTAGKTSCDKLRIIGSTECTACDTDLCNS